MLHNRAAPAARAARTLIHWRNLPNDNVKFPNFKGFKGLAKLGNIVAETLLRMQMFPNLAARETCVAETNFAARKQKMFLSGVKCLFSSDVFVAVAA